MTANLPFPDATSSNFLHSSSPPSLSSSMDRLMTPTQNRRKFSFPVALHSSSLLGDVGALSTRRRLSNVSDVVSRKLSNTIGWKSPPIPTQDIITQGKCLCGQYIRCRLKRSGIFNKKLGLQRIRSIIGTPAVHVVREVFPALNYVGEELERMHPKLYSSVTRQISRSAGGELHTPETASVLLHAVARDLFRKDITWGKVISLFAITGGLAVDCVRQGHPEYLPRLVEGIADVIEDELVAWINENGGWSGLNTHVRPETVEFSIFEWTAMSLSCVLGIFFIFYVIKFIGFHLIPKLMFKLCACQSSLFCMPLEQEDTFQDNRKPWKSLRSSSLGTSKEDIILQGKCLCGQYIRARLKRAGFLNRKILQRLRLMVETSPTLATRDVFPALNMMGEELERMHPRIYTNVSRQLSRVPFGELADANTAPYLLHAAAKELFKNEINWGKIISLFAIAGGLAVDIVRQGHYDFIQRLIEGTADIIEEDLAPWLLENGSWLGLLDHIRPTLPDHSFLSWLSIFVAILFGLYIISYLIKFIGNIFFSCV